MSSSVWVLPLLFFLLLFFVALPLIIIVAIAMRKKISKMDVPENASFIEINDARSPHCGGYKRGIVKEQVPCKNGCTRFRFYPTDYEQGDYKPIPPIQTIICKNEYIERSKKSQREIIRLINMIPEGDIETSDGRKSIEDSMKSYARMLNTSVVTKSMKALADQITMYATPYFDRKALNKLKEEMDALRKRDIEEKK